MKGVAEPTLWDWRPSAEEISYELSGGQQQQNAMIIDPSLLLADEPTGALIQNQLAHISGRAHENEIQTRCA